jgi:hypothetical protein
MTAPAAQPRYRETPEIAAAAKRMIRATGRRATTDVDALPLLQEIRDECDRVLVEAARGAHEYGWSWWEIGKRLGITRQAANKAFSPNAKQADGC